MGQEKKLLVILGAGSSIECGMPAVSDIDRLMQHWAADEARRTGASDRFSLAWRALANHLERGFLSDGTTPNFERVLSEVLALMQWVRPPGVGSALRLLVADGRMPPGMRFASGGPYAPYIGVKTLVSDLLGKLASHMRDQCLALDTAMPAIGRWRTLLDGLRSEFEVAIYNLNYDTIANTCWPKAFTGFDPDGAFDARSFHNRDWQGLMHPHGSVHFSLRPNLGEEIVWREDLQEEFYDCDAGQSADEKSDGRELPHHLDRGWFQTRPVAGGALQLLSKRTGA